MWRRVELMWTDVSEERMTSIIRVEISAAMNQREHVAADSETSIHTRCTRTRHHNKNTAFYMVSAAKTEILHDSNKI
jgi:hypothetical protein